MKLGVAILVLILITFGARLPGANAQETGPQEIQVYVLPDKGEVVTASVKGVAVERLGEAGFSILTLETPPPKTEKGATLTLQVSDVDGVVVRGTMIVDGFPVSSQRFCDCKIDDAEKLAERAGELVNGLLESHTERRSPASLVVRCDPEGLVLLLDGATPIQCGTNQVVSGEHTVVATKEGYERTTYVVSVGVGERALLIASPVARHQSKTHWYVLGAGVVAGVGLIGYGGAHVARDLGEIGGDGLRTKNNRSSKALGVGLIVGGVAVLGGAGVWAYILRKKSQREEGEPSVSPGLLGGGPGVVWSGTF